MRAGSGVQLLQSVHSGRRDLPGRWNSGNVTEQNYTTATNAGHTWITGLKSRVSSSDPTFANSTLGYCTQPTSFKGTVLDNYREIEPKINLSNIEDQFYQQNEIYIDAAILIMNCKFQI